MINTALSETFPKESECRKHTNALLLDAQSQLYDIFGYSVCTTNTSTNTSTSSSNNNQNTNPDNTTTNANTNTNTNTNANLMHMLSGKDSDKDDKYYLINNVMMEHNNKIKKYNANNAKNNANNANTGGNGDNETRRSSRSSNDNTNKNSNRVMETTLPIIPTCTLIYDKLSNLQTDQDAAYRGFVYVIFNIIWSSSGRNADESQILYQLRKMARGVYDTNTGTEFHSIISQNEEGWVCSGQ